MALAAVVVRPADLCFKRMCLTKPAAVLHVEAQLVIGQGTCTTRSDACSTGTGVIQRDSSVGCRWPGVVARANGVVDAGGDAFPGVWLGSSVRGPIGAGRTSLPEREQSALDAVGEGAREDPACAGWGSACACPVGGTWGPSRSSLTAVVGLAARRARSAVVRVGASTFEELPASPARASAMGGVTAACAGGECCGGRVPSAVPAARGLCASTGGEVGSFPRAGGPPPASE